MTGRRFNRARFRLGPWQTLWKNALGRRKAHIPNRDGAQSTVEWTLPGSGTGTKSSPKAARFLGSYVALDDFVFYFHQAGTVAERGIKGKIITLKIDDAEDIRVGNKTTTATIEKFKPNERVVKSESGGTSTFVR
jgi:hypothetical protein